MATNSEPNPFRFSVEGGPEGLKPVDVVSLEGAIQKLSPEQILSVQIIFGVLSGALEEVAASETLLGESAESAGDRVLASSHYGKGDGIRVVTDLMTTISSQLPRVEPIDGSQAKQSKPRKPNVSNTHVLEPKRSPKDNLAIVTSVGLEAADIRNVVKSSINAVHGWIDGKEIPIPDRDKEGLRKLAVVIHHLRVEFVLPDEDIRAFLQLVQRERNNSCEIPIAEIAGKDPTSVIKLAEEHFAKHIKNIQKTNKD